MLRRRHDVRFHIIISVILVPLCVPFGVLIFHTSHGSMEVYLFPSECPHILSQEFSYSSKRLFSQ